MNLKMFYCVENKNTYAADIYQKPSVLTLPLFTFFAVMLYVIGRNLRLDEITFFSCPNYNFFNRIWYSNGCSILFVYR